MTLVGSTMAADGWPRRAFTVAEVERMVDLGVIERNERFELIGGEIVPMAPKGLLHEVLKRCSSSAGSSTSPTTSC